MQTAYSSRTTCTRFRAGETLIQGDCSLVYHCEKMYCRELLTIGGKKSNWKISTIILASRIALLVISDVRYLTDLLCAWQSQWICDTTRGGRAFSETPDCWLRTKKEWNPIVHLHPAQTTCIGWALLWTCCKACLHQCFWFRANAGSFISSVTPEQAPISCFCARQIWLTQGQFSQGSWEDGWSGMGKDDLGRGWSSDVSIRPHSNIHPWTMWPSFGPLLHARTCVC